MSKITVTLTEEPPSQTSAGTSGMSYKEGEQVSVWYDEEDENWVYCYHGIAEDGNYFEDDNISDPDFVTQGLALLDAIVEYYDYDICYRKG